MHIILTILTLISVIPSSTMTASKNHVMTEMLLDDLRLNDYEKYNVRSWPTLISSNKFREQLIYNSEDYMGLLLDDSLRCYNGNAAMSIWRSPDQPWPRCYLYHYDALNRLTAADYSDGYALSNNLGGYSTAYSYDRHGNITAMQRHGQMDNGNFGLIDNLTFTYDGNQLRKVTDAAGSPTYTGVMDFRDGVNISAEYLYDSNGNATCDLNRGISSITYNLLSLPSQITFSTGATIQYTYNAEGRKLTVTHAPPPLSPSGQTTTDYCDNIIYKGGTLDRILTDEGYITIANNSPAYHYFLRDHLGSVRVVLNGSGTVEETTHYYPYGTTFPQTSVQPYKFCGKELDRVNGLDWYDSQARMYDPVLARWHTQDSKSEDYYNWSPYVYCAGNPVMYVDQDGRKVVFVNGYLGFGSPEGGDKYWHGNTSYFVRSAQATFNDYTPPFFSNYDYNYLESASLLRDMQGYQYAKSNYDALIQGMRPGKDKFNFISHSMGGAFSEGMMRYLAEQGWETENAVFLNAWEPAQIKNKVEKTRIDATCSNDPVQFLSKPVLGETDIPLSDYVIRIKSDKPIKYIHRDLIDENSNLLWKKIREFLLK